MIYQMALLIAIMLSGCQSVPKIYDYPNLGITVIKTDPVTVDRVCGRTIKISDNGQPITGRIRCCYTSGNLIWVSRTDIDCIFHELCHADGTRTKLECSDVY